MKLHANAPLGPKGRALMVRRVVDEGWSLTQAADGSAVWAESSPTRSRVDALRSERIGDQSRMARQELRPS